MVLIAGSACTYPLDLPMSKIISYLQTLLEQAIDFKPPVLPPDTPLKVAIAAMAQAIASCVLIAFEQLLLGILTERDVVKITASEIPLAGAVISEVMTENPIAISLALAENMFKILSILRSCSRAALKAKIRHLPITDEGGKLVGAIALESIRQILKPGDLLQRRRETRNYDRTSNSCLNWCIRFRSRKTDGNPAQKLHSHLHGQRQQKSKTCGHNYRTRYC
jgi:CBS domain-containing protein